MLSLFDNTQPVPEKAKTLSMYQGTLEELLVYLDNHPKCRGKFLSDNESAFQMEARAEEIHARLGLSPESFNLGMAYYHPETTLTFMGSTLNYDAKRFLPLTYIVVTENEKWANLWGDAKPVPTNEKA
jgi:hypothetical protein